MKKRYVSFLVTLFSIGWVIASLPAKLFAQTEVLTPPVAASGETEQDVKSQKQAAPKSNFMPARPAPSNDSAELKQLRSELAAMRKELSAAKASASETAELRKQNHELSTQLASAKKSSQSTADSAELRKQRSELAEARAELDKMKSAANAAPKQNFGSPRAAGEADIAKLNDQLSQAQSQNRELSAQLATARKAASTAESGELKKLRAELADAKKSESAEIKKLKNDLAQAQTDANRARKISADTQSLQKQNKELADQLAAARNATSSKASGDSAELKRARAELAEVRAEAERAKNDSKAAAKTQPQAETRQAKSGDAGGDMSILKRLREENSYLRNLLETYVEQVPELKGRLKKYQANAK